MLEAQFAHINFEDSHNLFTYTQVTCLIPLNILNANLTPTCVSLRYQDTHTKKKVKVSQRKVLTLQS